MADATCSVNDSTHSPRSRLTRGMCDKHYMRWWKYGDPLARKMLFGSAEERFWHYVNKRGPDECWPWGGTIRENGYGQIWADGKTTAPHIVAYRLAGKIVPDGLELDHLCHDPAICTPGKTCPHRRCCNPDHLEAVPRIVNTLRSGAPSAVNARKDACSRGHLFDDANTGWSVNRDRPRRYCRTCARENQSTPEGRAKKAAQAKTRYARNEPTDKKPRSVKTHCKRGHEFTEANTYLHDGKRHCKECGREANRQRKRRERAQKAAA